MTPATVSTVGELIEALQQYDPDAAVALAVQPEWPLHCTIAAVAESDGTVFISEGRQQGYVPSTALAALSRYTGRTRGQTRRQE